MKRTPLLVPILLVLASFGAPALQAQTPAPGKDQGQPLRKRDGSCGRPGRGCGQGRGQGLRKQDGSGPRGGTEACPKTPKAPAR